MAEDTERTLIGSFLTGHATSLSIEQHSVGDVTVLKLSGQLLLDDGEVAFRSCVEGLLAMGRTKLVLDIEAVSHIDSSGVGMLVGRLQSIRKLGGDIRLLHLADRYQRLLTTMRVLPLFTVFDDEAAAVQSYADAPPTR